MNAEQIDAARCEALELIAAAGCDAVLEELRVRFLGRKGMLPEMMKGLKDVPAPARGAAGKAANAFREELTAALAQRRQELSSPAVAAGAEFDASLPGRWRAAGMLHPVSRVISDAVAIFSRMGFVAAEGPDIETAWHNFEALNTPAYHPSLDDTDTFWLADGHLLRTQTSPVQIRVMEKQAPPIRIVTPGRCYRRDTTDATHSANFHQIEGLYVDRNVTLADLKGTLAFFAREMMGPGVKVRFRPHFFPFTEPSVECDFSCHVCGGKGCRVCKNSGWIEIAGAGMVDPRVFEKVGYNPDEWDGYAFGMGVERIAMIKYGVPDIRALYENDVRFLHAF